MEEVENLLILGNGFDLSSKLASNYGDFFKIRYSKEFSRLFKFNSFVPNMISSHLDGFTTNNIPININSRMIMGKYGLIDCLLLCYTEQCEDSIKWTDIERIILSFFIEESPVNLDGLSEHFYVNNVKNMKYPQFFGTDILREEDFSDGKELPTYYKQEIILELLCARDCLSLRVGNEEEIKVLLMAEFTRSLKNLEEDFKKYLQREVEKENSNYPLNAIKIYDALKIDFKQTYLLTFNYTTMNIFFHSTFSRSWYEENHVHGEIGTSRDIIFGIDENANSLNSEYYPFTKTYRKLLLDSQKNEPYKKLPSEVKEITFYGHSLSEADYAYFYSIFDFYKIYDSQVQMVFYYHNYLEDKSDTVLREQISNIGNLFKDYSENSKYTTKNLLHKLNLEGRVHIKEVVIKYDKDRIDRAEIK